MVVGYKDYDFLFKSNIYIINYNQIKRIKL
jgi:hypothetical protein